MRGRLIGTLMGALFLFAPALGDAQAYTFRYAKSWGGVFEDIYLDVCMDSSGNTYAAGIVRPTNVNRQVLVVKYSTTGAVLWSRSNIAAVATDQSVRVCLDGSGDVVVASGGAFEMRLDKLNKTTGATIATKTMSEDNAIIRGLLFHPATNSILWTFHEDASSASQRLRSVNASTFADNWNGFVSGARARTIKLLVGPDGSFYAGAEYGAFALVRRHDPVTGNLVWESTHPHPFTGNPFDVALLLGTANPIVTVNDPTLPVVKVLSRVNGSVLRTDTIRNSLVTALAPTFSAGYTAMSAVEAAGTVQQVMLKGEQIHRGSSFGKFGPAVSDAFGLGHAAGFHVVGGNPGDLGALHMTSGSRGQTPESFVTGDATAIVAVGTRVAVVGQVTDSTGNKQARVAHFTLNRFASNDVFGFRKNSTLNIPAPGVESNDGLAHNVTPIIVTQPTHGTLSLAGDGSFSYTPDADFTGSDSFTYRLGTGPNETATVSLNCMKPSTLNVPSAVTGGTPISGDVNIGVNTHVAVSVALSDNATGAAFPPSVVVPAGSRHGFFTGITVGVAADQNCAVTATLDGMTETETVLIQAAKPSSLVLNPNSLVGGQGFAGTVHASGPANTSGYAIAITHSGTEITTPINVFMPGGATQVSFNGSTIARSTQITHTVTATARGTSRTAQLTLNPGGLFGVTVAPTSIKGGTNAQGRLQTAGLAPPGGTLVALSTDGNQIAVPTTATVDAGQQFKNFVVTSIAVTSTTNRTIIASFGTVIKTTTLTLTP